jgi:hypothetical protein
MPSHAARKSSFDFSTSPLNHAPKAIRISFTVSKAVSINGPSPRKLVFHIAYTSARMLRRNKNAAPTIANAPIMGMARIVARTPNTTFSVIIIPINASSGARIARITPTAILHTVVMACQIRNIFSKVPNHSEI